MSASASTSLSVSSAPQRRALNALIFLTGVGGITVALTAGNRAAPALAEKLPVVLTAQDWSSGMPAFDATTATGQALTDSLGRIKAQPRQAAAWVQMGDVIAQSQRETNAAAWFDPAEKAYQTALRIKPDLAEAMAGMAWVFAGRHQFDISILWAEKALAQDAGHAAAHGIIGDAAVEMGDYEKAYDHYQKMMDLRPDLSSWSRGAWLLWLTGNQTKSVMLMEQAIRSGGPYAENTSWCRARLAIMLFQNGALLPAAQALEPALAKGTKSLHVLLAAGRIAAARQDFSGAEAFYRKVLAAGPNLEALIGLGDIAAVQQQPEEASRRYAEVEALHAQHRQTGVHDHMEMARFYADHDIKPAEALRLATEHGEVRNVFEADTMAWVLFRNGGQAKAIEFIKRALKTNTPDPAIQYHAGCIAAAAGDRVSAQNHLQKALNLNPQFSLLLAPQAVKMLEDFGTAAPAVPVSKPLPGGAALSRLK